MIRQRRQRVFVFTVSGRGKPPERYEIPGFDYEDARGEACDRYARKYDLSIVGPAFETKLENPDA
jgi:hypothetical protein